MPLKAEKKWGQSHIYLKSAISKLHPSFSQMVETMNDLKFYEKISIIDKLCLSNNPKRFSRSDFWNVGFALNTTKKNRNSAKISARKSKFCLILGPKEGLNKDLYEINRFISKTPELDIYQVNSSSALEDALVEKYIFAHPLRATDFNVSCEKIISPYEDLEGSEYFPIIIDNHYYFSDQYCSLKEPLTLLYAIAVCNAKKYDKILVAGFPLDHGRSDFMEIQSFGKLIDPELNKKIVHITPTNCNFGTKSNIFMGLSD